MSQKAQSDLFIRGGQTTQHWLRMAGQVFRGATTCAALVFVLAYGTLCATFYELPKIHMTWAHYVSTFFVENRGMPERPVRYKNPDTSEWVERPASEIYTDPEIQSISDDYHRLAKLYAWYAAIPTSIAYLIVCIVFYIAGRRLDGDEHVRGTFLVSSKDLKRWSFRKWKAYEKRFGKSFKTAPRYTIAGIQFPPNCVEAQTAISGTVGTGKSNAIKEMLDGVRANGGRAVIYDRMGALIRDFYDPETDIILNSFDQRSVSWTPFNEADRPEIFTQMAEVLIPDRSGSPDPFWSQAARIVFDYVARELLKRGETSNKALRDAILTIPSDQLASLLERTPGQHFLNADIAKTAGSIRANLVSELRFLEFLRDDGDPFSIRKWIKESETGFVFLSGDAERAAATRNVISTVFEIGANALMTCEESHDPKVWFFMDEVPTLNRMPFLPKSLAEIRQFGGAFVVGYQVYSQLEATYGDKDAQTIVGNLNNRIVLNTPDADTAERFSKSLGSEDVEEQRESLTVGAHEARDGVGFSKQRVERRIVTASQIQSLPQFEGYLRFAYDAPTAFVRFEPFSRDAQAKPFLPYVGDFPVGSMEEQAAVAAIHNGETPARKPFAAWDIDAQNAEFEKWRARLINDGHMWLADDGDRQEGFRQYFFARKREGKETSAIRPPVQDTTQMMGYPGTTEPVLRFDDLWPPKPTEDQKGDPSATDASQHPAGNTPQRKGSASSDDADMPPTPPLEAYDDYPIAPRAQTEMTLTHSAPTDQPFDADPPEQSQDSVSTETTPERVKQTKTGGGLRRLMKASFPQSSENTVRLFHAMKRGSDQ